MVEKPESYALIYTGGYLTQDQTDNVTLDGVPMSVGLNLGSFIHSIRDHHRIYSLPNSGSIFLCIEHANVEERNHPVAMMGNIYGFAVATTLWSEVGHPYSPLKSLVAIALESGSKKKNLIACLIAGGTVTSGSLWLTL